MEQASSAAEPESPCEPAASTPAEIGHASPTGTACPRPGLLIPITHPEVRSLAYRFLALLTVDVLVIAH